MGFIIKAILAVAKSLMKTKTVGGIFTKKKILKGMSKMIVGKTGSKPILDIVKMVNGVKNYGVKDYAMQRLIHSNKKIGQVYDKYQSEKRRQGELIFKKIKMEENRLEREFINAYKTGAGLVASNDFMEFKKFYTELLSEQEREFVKNIFKEEDTMRIVFNSSGILFGIYIPYGKKMNLGVMGLQLYGQKSSRNPSLFYNYIRIPKGLWNSLEKNPTGQNLGNRGLRENHNNRKYLTKQSIYYQK